MSSNGHRHYKGTNPFTEGYDFWSLAIRMIRQFLAYRRYGLQTQGLQLLSLRRRPQSHHPLIEETVPFVLLSSAGKESRNNLKGMSWQAENCLSCVWFRPNDPLNADFLERGRCVEPKLKAFELIVSGRDWCNLYKEVRQKQIDLLQEGKMKG